MGGGGKGGSSSSNALLAQEQARQAKITDGTSQINSLFDNQFTDDFYKDRGQSYLDYAYPQLQDQYANAMDELKYALDRSGTTNSSAYSSKLAELQKLYDTNRRTVANTAQDYENTAKSNVESARSNLISQLNSTADVSGTVDAANARAAALTSTPAYSALGQLFSTFLSGLNGYAAGSTSGGSNYSTGTTLYSPNSSSVKVSS